MGRGFDPDQSALRGGYSGTLEAQRWADSVTLTAQPEIVQLTEWLPDEGELCVQLRPPLSESKLLAAIGGVAAGEEGLRCVQEISPDGGQRMTVHNVRSARVAAAVERAILNAHDDMIKAVDTAA